MPIFRLASLAALVCGVLVAAPVEPKAPTPKFKLGKETTYIDGPLDKDGYLDYEAALNERLKGKTTPDTNAVVLLLKCFGPKPEGKELHADFYKELGVEAPPDKGEYLIPDSVHFREEMRGEESQAFFDLDARLRKRAWKAADSPKHAEWLKLNEKPLVFVIGASNRPDYFNPMISRDKDGRRGNLLGARLGHAQSCRYAASLLSTRSMHFVGEGKIDEALADALAIHRLGRLVTRGGFLIEYLVGIALQAIAHGCEVAIFEQGKPSAKQALAYRDELLKLSSIPTVAEKLNSERLMCLDAIQSTLKDGWDIFSFAWMDAKKSKMIVKGLDGDAILIMTNVWFDKYESAMKKPTRAERVAAVDIPDKELGTLKEGMKDLKSIDELVKQAEVEKLGAHVTERVGLAYVNILMPAFGKIGNAADRAEQLHRNGLLAAALAAHFADTQKYPDKLAALAPKYLDKLPVDIFSGKPLLYTETKTGYLFYSVGVNGADDGGQLLSEEPRGDDLGVRMPRK